MAVVAPFGAFVDPGGIVDDISVKQALAMPLLLLVAMLMVAAGISFVTGVVGWRVFAPYVGAWAAVTFLSILAWVFVEVARLAPTRADRPLQTVMRRLNQPCRVAPLPAVIFPLFLGCYTWAKVSIPFAVGYGWEEYWANADRLILGDDGWRLLHAIFPAWLAPAWTFFYAVIWGFALVFSGALIATFASRRFAATYFTALMLSWLIGGIIMAYGISAAGPVFAHLADPDLAGRFLPLRTELVRILAEDDLVLTSQRYLAAGLNVKIALKGGGISAMPSMHIATTTLLVLAAWKTRWIALALLFWLTTFLGSVYLGYHYAVDAPVAAAVATVCWAVARWIYRERTPSPAAANVGAISLAQQPVAL